MYKELRPFCIHYPIDIYVIPECIYRGSSIGTGFPMGTLGNDDLIKEAFSEVISCHILFLILLCIRCHAAYPLNCRHC